MADGYFPRPSFGPVRAALLGAVLVALAGCGGGGTEADEASEQAEEVLANPAHTGVEALDTSAADAVTREAMETVDLGSEGPESGEPGHDEVAAADEEAGESAGGEQAG